MSESERKTICKNRRARFQYEIEDTVEAGMVLTGSEVKAMRQGKAHLSDAYARIRNGEVWLIKSHVEPYDKAHSGGHSPERERKLLLHRREIHRLDGKLRESGRTLVPLEMYFKDGRVKVALALARGKRMHDKRQTIAKRDADRKLSRVLKRHVQKR